MKKAYYGTDKKIDQWVERVIQNEVFCCDSFLMEELFKKEIILMEEVENDYYTDDENDPEYDPEYAGDFVEVFEWYRISKWLYQNLSKLGQVVIDSDYGYWYGRTTTGQSMCLDSVFYNIYHSIDWS